MVGWSNLWKGTWLAGSIMEGNLVGWFNLRKGTWWAGPIFGKEHGWLVQSLEGNIIDWLII